MGWDSFDIKISSEALNVLPTSVDNQEKEDSADRNAELYVKAKDWVDIDQK